MKLRVLLLLAVFYSCSWAQEVSRRVVVDDVAAVVGGEIILSSEIKMAVLQAAQEVGIQITDTLAVKQLSIDVLEGEISNKILLHNAKEAKIEVTDDEINQLVANQINELRRRYPSDDAFRRDLAQAGQTLAGLKGIYRDQAKDELMRQNFLRERSHEFPRTKVSDEEAREFFEKQPVGNSPEQMKFQHMVIAPLPSDEVVGEAEARIDSVARMYARGADFAYLAEKHSDGPSAERGGELGFFSKGEMVKEFEEAAFNMRVGEVRKVKTKFGWHLIRVEARRQKEVRARHILAMTEITEADWERAHLKADSLRQLVLHGASFFKLAKEHSEFANELSENPSFQVLTNIQSPDIRNALLGELSPVSDTDYKISMPVESKPSGYLLVLLMERREEAPLRFEDIRRQIIERLQQSKAIEAYVDELRKKTYVDIRFKDWKPLDDGQ